VLRALLPGVDHLQNIHPLVVHFPLALLPTAAAFYVLAWVVRRETPAWIGFALLLAGTASAAVAVLTGLRAQQGVMVDPSVRERLLEHHEDWMLATLGAHAALAAWAVAGRPLPARGRALFLLLAVVALAIMARGADYGGRLVYDYNAGGSACGQPIEFTR
jgi:uncharacterized membrane protein